MAFAVLLDFVLRAGKADGYEESARGPRWLYWAPVVMILLIGSLILIQPDLPDALNTVLQFVLGIFFLVYFGGSLFVVVRNYAKADTELRASRGLGLMLAGAVIGLAPLLLLFLVSLLPGDVTVPGAEYLAFGLVAVPVTFAIAAVKGGESVT